MNFIEFLRTSILRTLTSDCLYQAAYKPGDSFAKEIHKINFYLRSISKILIYKPLRPVIKQAKFDIRCFIFPFVIQVNDILRFVPVNIIPNTTVFPKLHSIFSVMYKQL